VRAVATPTITWNGRKIPISDPGHGVGPATIQRVATTIETAT